MEAGEIGQRKGECKWRLGKRGGFKEVGKRSRGGGGASKRSSLWTGRRKEREERE